ncbi:glycoside hydrolase family 1 protein [Nocardioides sp. Iso805N]|uniref:glycoside hydrolase family 1 protein n=1 Tax=Nocardioides sp. Iso805N TaxID=1283287 RepID=UPI00037A5231|nr:family 1 glycosylhydrolase [Nocardioides sp. Iso805N]
MVAPQLPAGFRFGTVAAAYQVEGAVAEDGRGASIWDTFARRPGAILDGSDAASACDSYHRYPEDVALLRRLGVGAHRFSFPWTRFQAAGRGPLNPKAVDHYDRYLDALLDAGISPVATLYFHDLPQALEDDGGWLNRATIEAFATYAALLGERFADRVASWVPIQEPNAVAYLGYGTGRWAPGRDLVFGSAAAAHTLLVAHGRAVIALREAGAHDIGCANNHSPMWPASDDPADVGATKLIDTLWNGLFLESMLLGRYPVDLLPLAEEIVEEGDLATIRQPLDFYGVNFYHPWRVAAVAEDSESELPFQMTPLLGYPTTDMDWPVVPSALREWLVLTRARFRAALPPFVITENGASYGMGPDQHGVVDDQPRIDFLAGHLEAVAEACRRGVDVRGYYVGHLLDGWDWDEGFRQRYGLVHVDHASGARTPKRSFDWYAGVIAAQEHHLLG